MTTSLRGGVKGLYQKPRSEIIFVRSSKICVFQAVLLLLKS